MKKAIIPIILFAFSLTCVSARERTSTQIPDPEIAAALEMIRADSLLSYMQALQDFETRFMLAPNRRDVAVWIMDKFLSFGIPEVRLDSFLCYTGFGFDTLTWQYNVEAKITGATYPEHEILIMGHYDSYVGGGSGNPMITAPGANDNASGVVAALECARVISELEYEPAKTIIFLATAAEELMYGGDSGAKHYALQAFNDNRKPGLIVNNDMIAWNDGTWTVNLKHHENSAHILALTLDVLENYTTLNHIFGNLWTFADLEPFVQLGFHGIYFMENFTNQMYPYYHTIFDVVDHLDTSFHAEITQLSLGVIMHYDLIETDAALLGISDIPSANCSGVVSPAVLVANYGSGTITSMDIVCRLNQQEPITFSWTGNIAFLERLQIELEDIHFELLDDNELEITLENINGTEDQLLANNTRNLGFGKAMATPNEVKLRIRLDNNPQEISWDVKNASGEVVFSGGPYSIPNVVINETMIFDEHGCYTFSIYDAAGNGLQAPGHFLLYYGATVQILFGTNFGSIAQTQFDVGNTLHIKEPVAASHISFYPNPVQDHAFMEFKLRAGADVEASIYNLLGMKVLEIAREHMMPGLHSIGFETETLESGIYIISARFGDTLSTYKMVKQ